MKRVSFALLILALLAACGHRADLKLPPKEPEDKPAQSGTTL
jgi:predicted small lipoprotein YifL